jgi:hypothetical protein
VLKRAGGKAVGRVSLPDVFQQVEVALIARRALPGLRPPPTWGGHGSEAEEAKKSLDPMSGCRDLSIRWVRGLIVGG